MPVFHCQQFSVRQQQTAMKVCTDSLLFGAMAPIKAGDKVLDIGAGSGLLSLITAQLGAQRVTAVEISPEACREAELNFRLSPWANRLLAVEQDIQGFAQTDRLSYDLIISNPPFFERHFKAVAKDKRLARHTDSLPFAALVESAEQLLTPHGAFYVLLPTQAVQAFSTLAQAGGLFLGRRIAFQGFADKPAKVSALSFRRWATADQQTESLTIYAAKGVYTAACQGYLRPFLLRFAEA